MKLTTAMIKPFLCSKFNVSENQIKRGRKYKDSNGQVVREFNLGSKFVSVISALDDSQIVSINDLGNNDEILSDNGVKNKFNDYYFAVAEKAHFDSFVKMMVVSLVINPKKHWHKERCVYDQPLKIENSLSKLSIESPNETGDFEAYGYTDPLVVVNLLLNMGLEYSNDMAQSLTPQTGITFYIKP